VGPADPDAPQHKKSLSADQAEEALEILFTQWQVRPRRMPLQSRANTTTQTSAALRSDT
jgi:hypothetical protein